MEQKEASYMLSFSENDTIDWREEKIPHLSRFQRKISALYKAEEEQVEAKRLLGDADELSWETSVAPKTNSESTPPVQLGFPAMSRPLTGWTGQPGFLWSICFLQTTGSPLEPKHLCAKGCFKNSSEAPHKMQVPRVCLLPVTIRTIWKCSSQKNTLFFVVTGV